MKLAPAMYVTTSKPYKLSPPPTRLRSGKSQGQAQSPNGFCVACWQGARFYLLASRFGAHVLPLPAVGKILHLDAPAPLPCAAPALSTLLHGPSHPGAQRRQRLTRASPTESPREGRGGQRRRRDQMTLGPSSSMFFYLPGRGRHILRSFNRGSFT